MKLIRLTTKNFKKLGDFTVDFADGLNVIVGENAQGKSTLLQAVEAALFGVTVVPGKKENIPTWGQTSFSLELQFYAGDSVYFLTRTKTTAKLVRHSGLPDGDELVANGNTAVTAYIEELLGLTAKDFNLFIQSRQGETSGVLTFGATALNQKVEEFAGISLIDAVAKRAGDIAAAQRAVAAACDVDSGQLQAARDSADAAATRLTEARAAVKAAEQVLADLPPLDSKLPEVSSQQLTEQRRRADKKAAELSDARADLALKVQAVSAAEQALADAGEPVEIETLKKEVAGAKIGLARGRERRAELQSEKSSAEQARKALSEAMSDAQLAEEAYDPSRPDALLAEHAKVTDEAKAAGEALAVDKARLKDMQSLKDGAVCPTCSTKLTEHDPKKLAEEIRILKDRVSLNQGIESGCKASLAALEEEIAAQRAAGVNLQQAQQRLQRAEEAIAAIRPGIEDELADAEAALGQAESQLAKANAALDAAAAVNDRHNSATNRLDKAKRALAGAEDLVRSLEEQQMPRPTDVEIDSAAQAEHAYREAERAYERRRSELNNATVIANGKLSKAEADAGHAANELKRLADSADQAHAARELLSKAGRLARFLADRRQAYLREVWDTVLASASKQVRSATRGAITRITNDGEFGFEEDGVIAPVTSASGAQRAFIGSAVRIGLARALYGSDSLLIFDEPTESMSEHNASGLAASLVGAARQCLLITHREQDQSLAANIIEVGA